MNVIDFVQRLLTKRCVSFYGRNDRYLLTTGEHGYSGFTDIGTAGEKFPLVLANCLSYDEIKLSALLSVTSHSEFINNGTRANCGEIEVDKSKIERDGVIIGIIGARFERPMYMEYQDIVASAKQNVLANGYGSSPNRESDEERQQFEYRAIWNEFYGENCSRLFRDVQMDGLRYVRSKNKNDIFDCQLMRKRYAMSFDTLLLEAEARAAVSTNKMAYIHVIGIGLGVWRAVGNQETVFLESFSERLNALLPKLQHIGWIHFSWFKTTVCGALKNGAIIRSPEHAAGITIFISNRNPADKLVSHWFLIADRT